MKGHSSHMTISSTVQTTRADQVPHALSLPTAEIHDNTHRVEAKADQTHRSTQPPISTWEHRSWEHAELVTEANML